MRSSSPADSARLWMLAYCLKVHRVRFVACLDALKSTQAWPCLFLAARFRFPFCISISHARLYSTEARKSRVDQWIVKYAPLIGHTVLEGALDVASAKRPRTRGKSLNSSKQTQTRSRRLVSSSSFDLRPSRIHTGQNTGLCARLIPQRRRGISLKRTRFGM